MKKHSFSLERLAVWVAGLCGLGALGLISVLAVICFAAGEIIYEETIHLYRDTLLLPLAVFCMAACLWFCKERPFTGRVLWGLTGFVCVGITVFCCVWLYQDRALPYGDMDEVYKAAVQLVNGDASVLNSSYYWTYPHQYSLVFIFEALLRLAGNSSSEVIGYYNLAFLLAIVIFGRLIADELFESKAVSACWLILCAGCWPLLMMVSFVYGEYLSWGALMAAIWCVVKLIKAKKHTILWALAAAVLCGFAVAARRNSLIFVIALLLVVLVYAISEKQQRILRLGAVALLAVSMVLPPQLAGWHYTQLTGAVAHKGTPPTAHINMGLADTYRGPGWYNGYVYEVYAQNGFDDAKAREQAAQDLKQTVAQLTASKRGMVSFFARKLATIWAEPSYQCFISTECHDVSRGRVGMVYTVFENTKVYDSVNKFMNAYQTLVYLAALGAVAVLLLGKNRKKTRLLLLLPLVVFLGGFCFHVVWETKSRYVLSYLPMLMLYAALGLGTAAGWVNGWLLPQAKSWLWRVKIEKNEAPPSGYPTKNRL